MVQHANAVYETFSSKISLSFRTHTTVKMPMCVVILVLKYEQGEVWAESQSSCVVVDSRW